MSALWITLQGFGKIATDLVLPALALAAVVLIIWHAHTRAGGTR